MNVTLPVEDPKRLIVAITGASGAVLGLKLLELMRSAQGWETHLVMSPSALLTAQQELGVGRETFHALASGGVYPHKDIAAVISSGSFRTEGMVIIPCSMNTLAAIAHGSSDNLITRAADVMLKERRRLILVPREAPLNLIQLRNMVSVTEAGGVIVPPVPAFYLGLETLEQAARQMAGRILDQFGIHLPIVKRWQGMRGPVATGSGTSSAP